MTNGNDHVCEPYSSHPDTGFRCRCGRTSPSGTGPFVAATTRACAVCAAPTSEDGERPLCAWHREIAPTLTKIAIIGDGGLYPVVWGLGDTVEDALQDARDSDVDNHGWDSRGWTSLEIDATVIAKIEAGVVDCMGLGIRVTVDPDGEIKRAEIEG